MAQGKPVGFGLLVVGLFLGAVVFGRLLLVWGPVVLLVAAPLVFLLLGIRGGWGRSLVATVIFVILSVAVWGLSLRPTLALIGILLGLLVAAGGTITWKALRPALLPETVSPSDEAPSPESVGDQKRPDE